MEDGLQASVDKMRDAGVADDVIATFRAQYEALRSGSAGLMPEDEISPVEELPDAETLPEPADSPVDRAVVIKLNGGLGTSMGMTKAKSLLEVKPGLTFLDVIARQVLDLRLPLVLMNSFATREDSLAALARHPELARGDVPPDFLQSRVPKLDAGALSPVEWPADPSLEWAPPGHGDLYPSLRGSGLLSKLLDSGFRYAFVSNADNLGAVLDPRILAWFAREEAPFAMEVADRTEADRKGGHVARRRDGGLVLREVAQTPDENLPSFQDIARHRYFNTNNLWIDLRALAELLERRGGVLGLPMIVNRKTVDPTDPDSTPVIQLETAMGAAIGVFEGARALRVPRGRFVPVKTTNDLLVVRSDAYELLDDGRIALGGGRSTAPLVELDDEYYKLLADFEARFPHGPPSLARAERLRVKGDVRFGKGVVVRGDVSVNGPAELPDGAVLQAAP
jgi:UTP--glucose-1-phosphate uridylyltransferase